MEYIKSSHQFKNNFFPIPAFFKVFWGVFCSTTFRSWLEVNWKIEISRFHQSSRFCYKKNLLDGIFQNNKITYLSGFFMCVWSLLRSINLLAVKVLFPICLIFPYLTIAYNKVISFIYKMLKRMTHTWNWLLLNLISCFSPHSSKVRVIHGLA